VFIPKKQLYALRALCELARRYRAGPVKIAEIAEAQAVPARFLEIILGQLKGGGFVESRRGYEGGYLLARPPRQLTAGQVIRFLEGTDDADGPDEDDVCSAFWNRVREAVSDVYDTTTLQDLADEALRGSRFVPNFAI